MKKPGIRVTAVLLATLCIFCLLTGCGYEATSEGDEPSVSGSDTSDVAVIEDPEARPNNTTDSVNNTESVDETEQEVIPKSAICLIDTPLISDTSSYEIVEICTEGSEFQVLDITNTLWISVQNGDKSGYVYSGDVAFSLEDTSRSLDSQVQDDSASDSTEDSTSKPNDYNTDVSAVEQLVISKINKLSKQFPEGYYWNHVGQDYYGLDYSDSVTDTPCDHNEIGYEYCNIYNGKTLNSFSEYGELTQCLGFASLLSDRIFGMNAPVYIYYDSSQMRLGDHIRMHDYEHSMTIVDFNDEYVTVAEVNENYNDCAISWSRKISISELQDLSWDIEYLTRYPVFRDDAGNLLTEDNHLIVLD